MKPRAIFAGRGYLIAEMSRGLACLVVATGLHDVWMRKVGHGDVRLRLVVAGTPAAAITANNDTGWQLTRIDTAAYEGRVVSVRFEITSPNPYARHFALAAEARR